MATLAQIKVKQAINNAAIAMKKIREHSTSMTSESNYEAKKQEELRAQKK